MSERRDQKRCDYSKYDAMSTEALEQILRLDFQASEDEQSDVDAILYIAEVIAARKGQPTDADTDDAWQRFQTKYRPYADGHSLYDFDDEHVVSAQRPERDLSSDLAGARMHVRHHRTRRRLRLRRLVMLVALLAACLFGGLMVAQAAGIDVLGVIGRWTDETFRFVTTGSTNPSVHEVDEGYVAQIESVLSEWGANKDLFPTWRPEGFIPQEPRITSNGNSDTLSMGFKGEDRTYSVRMLHFRHAGNSTGIFEKDDSHVEEYVHHGYRFYIFSNIDTVTATCYNGEFMITISGALTLDEVKDIIDSIGGE